MKHICSFTFALLFLTGCSPRVGFGIGGVAGGHNGGMEMIATQDGIHGSITAGGDFAH